jgi:hypothetical protein
MTTSGFHCATCGDYHAELPLVLGNPAPAAWEALSPEDRTEYCGLSSDQCVIKGEQFFILGRLEIPITDGDEQFTWLCWVSVSEKHFDRACELWQQEGRETEPSYVARVQSALPYPGGTLDLEANLVTRPLGQRPLVILQQSNHPLYVEQSQGRSMARVRQIVEAALHEA